MKFANHNTITNNCRKRLRLAGLGTFNSTMGLVLRYFRLLIHEKILDKL